MTNERSKHQPRTLSLITGRVGTGKTTEIVKRVCNLVKQGEDPSLIAVFAPTPLACRALASHLQQALGNKADAITVTTLLEQELTLLATPEAKTATGREPRTLLRFEQNILMEDMKTSRVQPRRLAEMLKFFYRSWAELEPMDQAWFYNEEEQRVHALLKRYLDFMQAYLPAEVARVAHDFVLEHGGLSHYRHVFVDDYQKLSKASQRLAALIACESLTIAGDELSPTTALEEFPHTQGIAEFLAEHPGCEHLDLSTSHCDNAVAETLNALLSDPAINSSPITHGATAPNGTSAVLPFLRPHDEFEGIAEKVRTLLQDGSSADSIAVLAPNSIWARNLTHALERRSIPTSQLSHLQIAGDVRDLSACQEARAVTMLKLIARPDDTTALRCWCGFGDHLANSNLFSLVAQGACAISLTGVSASSTRAQNKLTLNETSRIDQALEQARTIIATTASLEGKELVRAILQALDIPEHTPAALRLLTLTDALPANANAAELCTEINRRALMPRISGEGVFVGLFGDIAGCSMDSILLSGLVNGFTPARSYFDPTIVERDKRPALLKRDMERIYECVGKAKRCLTISYFTEIPLADAEKLALKVFRVRLKNKERVCEIHPSETMRAITGEHFND